jgi:acetylglutamate kinase
MGRTGSFIRNAHSTQGKYLSMHHQPLHIIKVGGNIIDDEHKLQSFLNSFASFPGKKILIHGGGKLATKLAADLNIPQQMVDGRRITDTDTLRIVTMVYAGYINKNIVATLQSKGCSAIGLCGADANIIQAHKRVHPTLDFGFVGDVDNIDAAMLSNLLESGLTVIMAPITHDGKGQLLNTNADTIAQEIAKAMSVHYQTTLIYCFEKAGVLMDAEDENTLIPLIDPSAFKKLKSEQKIFAGMIPKLENAFKALESGVNKVVIGNAEAWDALMAGKSGTTISL